MSDDMGRDIEINCSHGAVLRLHTVQRMVHQQVCYYRG